MSELKLIRVVVDVGAGEQTCEEIGVDVGAGERTQEERVGAGERNLDEVEAEAVLAAVVRWSLQREFLRFGWRILWWKFVLEMT